MANSLGQLVVSLGLDAAQYVAGWTKAEYQAKKSLNEIKKAIEGVGGTIKNIAGAVGIGVGVNAFVGLIKGSIDAADHLQDLSKQTGVAVETLGGIGFLAKQSGSDLEGVAHAFGKLNLAIAAGAAGNEKEADAFSKIGISIKDLQSQSPEQIFAKIADSFLKYADGPQKAALANAFFSKSYKDIIPLLDEGGQKILETIAYYEKYSGISKELTTKADEFNDTVEKAKLLQGAFANTLAAKLLPSLQGLVGLFVDSKEKGDGFAGTADRIVDGLKVVAKVAAFVAIGFVDIGDLLGSLAARANALAHLDFKAFSSIGDERARSLEKSKADYQKIADAIDGKGATAGPSLPKPTKRAPALDSANAGDTAKKFLEQQLKEQESIVKAQANILADSEKVLQLYYQDDLIGLKDFYASRQALQQSALQTTLQAYDAEIKAAQSFIASAAKPQDRNDGETKLADTVAKRAEAVRAAATKDIESAFEAKRAMRDYGDAVAELSAQVLVLSGNERAAAEIRFDIANRGIVAKAKLAGDQGTLDNVAKLRAQQGAQLDLNKAAHEYSNTQAELAIAQGRIALAQQTGSIGELDAIKQRSAAAVEYTAKLRAQADEQERVAQTLTGQAQIDAILNIKKLRLEIDQLTASADELANKFTNLGIGAFSDALTDIATRSKTVGQAIADMAKSITASIARIASQNIAEAVFGKSGVGSGFGGFLAGLFGGGGGGGGIGYGATSGDIFPVGLPYANGTNFATGGVHVVGERGPELVSLPRGAQVTPNNVVSMMGRRGGDVTNYITVPNGTSTATADQIATKTAAAVQRSQYRNA